MASEEDDGLSVRGTEWDEDEPDADEMNMITEEYITEHVTFLSVKCCKTCAHSSKEVNPLAKGKYARGRRQPTWPWRYGCPTNPKGLVCRICETAFLLGGFIEEHKTMDVMMECMRASDTLTEEFGEASTQVIALINAGPYVNPKP
jgi:hypothetical protein